MLQAAKRVHVIACGVLAIDLKDIAARLGIDLSMEFLPGGLHSRPRELRQRLQEAIDQASAAARGDVIAVGYGVCGMGAVGIHARNVPLAIPKVNDCIALFMGSDAAYREQFAKFPGTYYLSAGWVEEKAQPQTKDDGKTVCGTETVEFRELVAKHGRENAEAVRYFLNSWQRNYQRAAFIDTGASGKKRFYADLAAGMAKQFGWLYEEIEGSPTLLEKLLKATVTTEEILIVPPHHVTAYDAMRKTLTAVPVWETTGAKSGAEQMLVFEEDGGGNGNGSGNGRENSSNCLSGKTGTDTAAKGAASQSPVSQPVRTGLGIDAGGTYTDVVIYNFDSAKVLQKAKALTTRYDYTVGIDAALDQLDAALVAKVELVSISTTLATNAIVEGKGQKVGLLLMPPYGRFYPEDITHQPLAVVAGKMEIDGREIAPIDGDQVRRAVREMIDTHRVGALAVVGYASHVNPAHELAIADIIRNEFGLSVTCGQDVSEGANYIVRATTAVLNARIIPYLESLLAQVQVSLSRRSIAAPVMVVKSDGALMNVTTARMRPVETILCGPAASVAGASYLAGVADAIVVDIGGTTTDTATIVEGTVKTCEDGATVGGHRTHVRALDIRTMGLGGDSLIAWEKGRLAIGPRRVAPACWLAVQSPKADDALDWIGRHLDQFDSGTRGMDLLMLTGRGSTAALTEKEKFILSILADCPMCAAELARRMSDTVVWEFLPLEHLEENHLVQRCGLTPTDLLHVTGQVSLWDAAASRKLAGMFAKLLNLGIEDFAARAMDQAVRDLTVELIRKQLDEQGITQDVADSPAAAALVRNLLDGGSAGYKVGIQFRRPLVGIGAPVQYLLPQAAKLLQTQVIIPPNADVANAIGAITSSVCIRKQVMICPADGGGYGIEGLAAAPKFGNFEAAHDHALAQLVKLVRRQGKAQGTSTSRVEVLVRDRIATVADGSQLFVGRTLDARLSGRPDLARLTTE